MKIPVIHFIILSVIFLTFGCNDSVTDPEDIPDIPDYMGLNVDNLPASVHLDVPIRGGRGPFCQIQSLAMIVAFLDSTATVEEMFAYSGLGAGLSFNDWHKWFIAFPDIEPATEPHLLALQNYGARFVIGAGVFPRGYHSIIQHASGKLNYTTSDDALKYLRGAVASGRPVQVHIDMGELPSLYDMRHPLGTSHFIIVTGYDAEAVYVNEIPPPHETDPFRWKHVRIPLEEFIRAWHAPGNFPDVFGWKAGPYWMLIFEQTSPEALEKKSANEILALHKEWSRNIASVIDHGIVSNPLNTNWGHIGQVREAFGYYLLQLGNQSAGSVYVSLSHEYYSLTHMTADQIRTRVSGTIKALELDARTKY